MRGTRGTSRLPLMRARAAVPSCLSHAWDTWDTWDSGCTRLAPRAGSLNLGLFAPGLRAPLIRGGHDADLDEALVHVVLALAQVADARQAGCDDLHRHQGFHL